MKKPAPNFVLPETILLITICMLDLFYTLYLVRTGRAHEANPILKRSLDTSDLAFILLKGGSFLVPVALLEILRPINPRFVLTALRLALIAYGVVYSVGIVGLSHVV